LLRAHRLGVRQSLPPRREPQVIPARPGRTAPYPAAGIQPRQEAWSPRGVQAQRADAWLGSALRDRVSRQWRPWAAGDRSQSTAHHLCRSA